MKTNCIRGHEMTGDNVVFTGNKVRHRLCRECRNIRADNWRKGKSKKRIAGGPTSCPKGHKYSLDNIRWKKKGEGWVKCCKQCARDYHQRKYWSDPLGSRERARVSARKHQKATYRRHKERLAHDPVYRENFIADRKVWNARTRARYRDKINAKQNFRYHNDVGFRLRSREYGRLKYSSNKERLSAEGKAKRRARTGLEKLADAARKKAYYERTKARRREYSREYYYAHRKELIAKAKDYVRECPEVTRIKKTDYQRRPEVKARRPEYHRRYIQKGGERVKQATIQNSRKRIERLSDGYVKAMMRQAGYGPEAVKDPRMVEAYRILLELKRNSGQTWKTRRKSSSTTSATSASV